MTFSDRIRIFFALSFCFLAFRAGAKPLAGSDEAPLKEIREYIRRGDTNDLSAALYVINQNYNRYHGKEFLALLMEAEKHSEQTDLYRLYGFYSLIRRYYEEEGNSSMAMEYALKSYNMLKNNPEDPALYWLLVDIGNIFFNIRDFNQAQVFYEKSIGIANRLKESYGMSVIYLNLGMVAEQKKEYSLALKYYKLSTSYRVISGNSKFISATYISISDAYFKMDKPDSALYYIKQARYYYDNFGADTDFLVYIPANCDLGYYQYYAAMNNFPKAEFYLARARKDMLEKNLSGMYTASFFIEASSLTKVGRYAEASEALLKILPSIREKRILITERDIYKLLTECYNKLQRYEEASKYFHKYIVIEDSLESISMQTQFNSIRAITEVHESEVKLGEMKKDMEIAQLNNEMERRQNKVSSNIAALAITCLLVLALLFWLYVQRGKKLEKMQGKLREQNNNIKIQSNELRRSNQVKDKIFSVIAHDLRNPLNRLLVELALIKQEMPEQRSGVTAAMENTLKETIELFERLLQWSKRDNKQIVYSPSVQSLAECINKVISFYLSDIQSGNIAVVNKCTGLSAFVDANVLLTLLRNILGNAIKAVDNGGTIEIRCDQLNENEIELTFADSGSGFSDYILDEFNNESKVEAVGQGTGLMLCKMLAKFNGWPIRLSNDSPYGGARISLIIPAFRKKHDQEESTELTSVRLSEKLKAQLLPIRSFKLYQTSELRQFLKSIPTDDPDAEAWVRSAQDAIRDGNKDLYEKLLKMLD